MPQNKRLLISSLVIVALVAGMWVGGSLSAATSQLGPTLLLNVTSGKEDLHSATMALQLAGHGLDGGQNVIIFLNVRAVEFGTKPMSDKLAFQDNPPLKEMLKKLMERGAKVIVCPHCMKATDISEDNLLPGVEMASREKLFGALDPSAIVFSY